VSMATSYASEWLLGRGTSPSAPSSNRPWGIRTWLRLLTVPILAVVMLAASPLSANASYFLLAVYAFAGPRQTVTALFLLWGFNLINHAVVPPASLAAFTRHLVILSAALAGVARLGMTSSVPGMRSLNVLSALLCLFIILHAVFFSAVTDISLLKGLSFGLTVLALLAAWSVMSRDERRATAGTIFGGLMLIAVLSIPLVATQAGYMRTRSGFQGLMIHPQAFGPTMALLAAWLAASMLTNRRLTFSQLGMLALSVAWIYLSKARVGAFGLAMGMAAAVGINLLEGIVARARKVPRLLWWRAIGVLGLGLLGSALAWPYVGKEARSFIAKSGDNEASLGDLAMRSRGRLIEQMLANIQERPLLGVGFGVSSDPEDWHIIVRDPVLGLPTMAPVEKGVMPIAIMEELGAPGFVLAMGWVLALIGQAAKGGLVPLAVCCTALATNLAEATLFSPGGMGLLILVLVTWAATERPPGRLAVTGSAAPRLRYRPSSAVANST